MAPLDCLCRCPLFKLLGRRKLEAWLAAGLVQALSTGELLCQAGTTGAWAFLVLRGEVRVLTPAGEGRDVSLGTFGPGEVFGEYALLPPHFNTATCLAQGPAQVLRLPLAPVRKALAQCPDVQPNLKRWLRLNALVAFLRQRTFLGFMSANSALPFLDACRSQAFPAGEAIQADGLADDRWFVLERGVVRLISPGPDGEAAILGPGDCFGEGALAGRPGLPVAIALTDVQCLCLTQQNFGPPSAGPRTPSLQSFDLARVGARPFPWIGQQAATDCGLAALAMLASCHGRQVALEELRPMVNLGERGATLLALQQAAARLGLTARAVRVAPERLGEVGLPAVAHLRDGHYAVLYALRAEEAVLGDPASGIVTWSLPVLQDACSGNFLVCGAHALVGTT